MRIGIVGSRYYNKYLDFYTKLGELPVGNLFITDKPLTIVTGDARGVDEMAAKLANFIHASLVVCKADWDTHGLAAGPIRNKEIIDQCDVLIAFWDGSSKGTKSSIDLAIKKGINIIIIPVENDKK